MFFKTVLAAAAFTALATAATNNSLPSLDVPRCPSKGYLRYNLSSPDLAAFPETAVEICYDDSALHVDLWAYEETDWYYDSNLTTNGAIWNYEVMEVFIALGASDPTTYFEFEVAPDNVTFNVCTPLCPDVLRAIVQPLCSIAQLTYRCLGVHIQSIHQQNHWRTLRHNLSARSRR